MHQNTGNQIYSIQFFLWGVIQIFDHKLPLVKKHLVKSVAKKSEQVTCSSRALSTDHISGEAAPGSSGGPRHGPPDPDQATRDFIDFLKPLRPGREIFKQCRAFTESMFYKRVRGVHRRHVVQEGEAWPGGVARGAWPGGATIYRCRYIKDVHRTKCQTLTITRLTHSL